MYGELRVLRRGRGCKVLLRAELARRGVNWGRVNVRGMMKVGGLGVVRCCGMGGRRKKGRRQGGVQEAATRLCQHICDKGAVSTEGKVVQVAPVYAMHFGMINNPLGRKGEERSNKSFDATL